MNWDILDAWENLNFECQRVVSANTENLSERIKQMNDYRLVFDQLLRTSYINEMKENNHETHY